MGHKGLRDREVALLSFIRYTFKTSSIEYLLKYAIREHSKKCTAAKKAYFILRIIKRVEVYGRLFLVQVTLKSK